MCASVVILRLCLEKSFKMFFLRPSVLGPGSSTTASPSSLADDGELLVAEADYGPRPSDSIRRKILCYAWIEGNRVELDEGLDLRVGDGLEPFDGGVGWLT